MTRESGMDNLLSPADGQTVMQFTYVEFDENWSRQSADNYKYALTEGASLVVVSESSTGEKTTYWYSVKKDEHVWIGGVNGDENIIYIPSRFTESKKGDYLMRTENY